MCVDVETSLKIFHLKPPDSFLVMRHVIRNINSIFSAANNRENGWVFDELRY